MKLVDKEISLDELKEMSEKMFGDYVKAVVDLKKNVMAVDAHMHADQELSLLENGSDQGDLWGINLHPLSFGTSEWVEFDSMINLRPSWGNKSRGVDNPKTQQEIIYLVNKLVKQ
ncbi:hypothetical protein KAT92_04060 [Candidatus Babeliales bacterium]|nr:hypothetical protein [Candidatus Babeliales bacterium]